MLGHNKGFVSIDRLSLGPWQAFERMIARLLAHQGWDTYDVVGGSGDKGADVICSKNNVEVIFQCKFSTRSGILSVDIAGDIKRAIDFYEIYNGVCTSNRDLSSSQLRKIKVLQEQGYNISVFTGRDIYDTFTGLQDWPHEKRILRPYQQLAVEKIIDSYINNSKKGLISLATGLGKTFVAASFLKWYFKQNYNRNVLILADKKELLLQFDKSIWTSLPKYVDTHLLYDSEKPINNNGIVLSTFQSFENYLINNPGIYFDLVIVDEAHHAPAATYKSLLVKLNPEYLLGLTATPFRKDQKNVFELFGEPLIYFDVIKAMKYGYLASVDYRVKSDNIDYDWLATNSAKGYTVRQLNKKLFLPQRDDVICQEIMEYWHLKKPQRGIIFCNSSLHAKRIEELIRSVYNFPIRSLTTLVKSSEERAKRLRKFRKGDIKILSCYDMLNEGVDVPDVDFLVYLRVTHSRTIFLQQLGRGLRFTEGKTLYVFDYVADLRRLMAINSFINNYKNEYKDSSSGIEEVFLPSAAKIEFNDRESQNFTNLIYKDHQDIEDLELDDVL